MHRTWPDRKHEIYWLVRVNIKMNNIFDDKNIAIHLRYNYLAISNKACPLSITMDFG